MQASDAALVARKILVVDDEPEIVQIVERYLTDEGFFVSRSYDGAEALRQFNESKPDLIILDLRMPVKNGLEAFREIRAISDVPIIMLTSKNEEVDRILGLELGADDYVSKPFSPRELVARVKTVLRRATAAHEAQARTDASGPATSVMRVGDLEVDPKEHEVRLAGRPVQLTPTEFRILAVLAASPGQTFTRTQLLDRVKSDDLEMYDRTLDRHIANLRHKIEEDPAAPRYVLTVFGVGYKMAKRP
jgi:DNA-binding response OmpR family regulator